jgi:hypothetical protein
MHRKIGQRLDTILTNPGGMQLQSPASMDGTIYPAGTRVMGLARRCIATKVGTYQDHPFHFVAQDLAEGHKLANSHWQ